jgi:hypothetical protein
MEERLVRDTPYQRWQRGEGVPIYNGSFIGDLNAAEVKPWARLGQRGAIVNLANQELDDGWLIEIAPGGKTDEIRHMFEAAIYVLSGRGATTFSQPGSSEKRTVEWQEGSLFAPPLNCRYQHFNLDGQRPVRLFAATMAPLMMDVINSQEFIFNCQHVFRDRYDEAEDFFSGPGERLGTRRWRTNFVPDARGFQLEEWKERGAGGAAMYYEMAGNGMHIHTSEFPTGTYKKGHAHQAGAEIIILNGLGYSLLWKEGEERRKVDWKPGTLFGPAEGEFHQHFNTGQTPARYLAYTLTGVVINNAEAITSGRVAVQVEYENEDPEVYRLFERECEQHGVAPRLDHPLAKAATGSGRA